MGISSCLYRLNKRDKTCGISCICINLVFARSKITVSLIVILMILSLLVIQPPACYYHTTQGIIFWNNIYAFSSILFIFVGVVPNIQCLNPTSFDIKSAQNKKNPFLVVSFKCNFFCYFHVVYYKWLPLLICNMTLQIAN